MACSRSIAVFVYDASPQLHTLDHFYCIHFVCCKSIRPLEVRTPWNAFLLFAPLIDWRGSTLHYLNSYIKPLCFTNFTISSPSSQKFVNATYAAKMAGR